MDNGYGTIHTPVEVKLWILVVSSDPKVALEL